ncbi:uncharacterized protein C21orf62-like isoform X2 [Gambusia affinis]|uniref:Uncharacterized protein n=2 Tax=Gambusia affinis TaxID=33528 RepID=A0A315VSV4_GAMAF|nr:uncharacterized protein C21orf62-like isoform X2 [Gambusia affinis]XP_043987624.1 uncharacterized protein C21orf62-like isoform X2 [Gambusia affinis]XP_043987625.1 uncharacterized protein C21orf62-like isoform X2 [Gambusia affinis]XP_043987626.1 uncharacterized protein C21orf62-like isoform X2 [Gambusia affinis]PWA26244.1 hypothetical protein CCH79_00013725 [Gambusia affinis]
MTNVSSEFDLPAREDVVSSVSMEMPPNAARSAWLPWSLWLMFALTSDCQPMLFDPEAANATLLFDSGGGLRTCSCPAPVPDCDAAQGVSRCRCSTVPRSELDRASLGRTVAVWVRELWVLEELLNSSAVAHLRLSFCGAEPLQSRQLVLLGLRSLSVHSAAPGAPYPDQEVRVSPSVGAAPEPDSSASHHMSFVDVGVLNGLSALKAYSVIGPPLHTFSQFFPHLVFPLESKENASEPSQQTLVTFVY